MSRRSPTTRGQQLANQLFEALHASGQVPIAGARDLPPLEGLTARGGFIHPQENVIPRAIDLLMRDQRLFTYGDTIVQTIKSLDGETDSLVTLRTGSKVETGAEDFLANLMVCRSDDLEFPCPRWFAEVLLRAEPLTAALPRIRAYQPVVKVVFPLHHLLHRDKLQRLYSGGYGWR